MENIWLRYKEPEAYASISERINKDIASRQKDINEFVTPIEQALKAAGYSFQIKKRIKTPYSIWYKMQTKHVPFEEIYDILAVRIIFEPKSMEEELNSISAATSIMVTTINKCLIANDMFPVLLL